MPQTMARHANVADFTLKLGDLTTDDVRVVSFRGREGLSELYSFSLELCSPDPALDVEGAVAKSALLEIGSPNGSRFVHGIVRLFERTGEGTRTTYYAAELVPVHWLLTQRFRSRIFQSHNCSDMTVGGIIKKVFEDAGIPSGAYRFSLQGSYTAREYVVQYRESEFDFISRLMEEEGIFYYFEHAPEGHKIVLADSPSAHVAAMVDQIAFREKSGLVPDLNAETFHTVRDARQIQPGAATLDSFNFQQVTAPLHARKTDSAFTSLQHSDYLHGRYTDKAIGENWAQVQLEGFLARRREIELRGGVRTLLPGRKFTLTEHPTCPALNAEYVVTHITHHGTQPQSAEEESEGQQGAEYQAIVRTIPASTAFRPPRVTPKPRVFGSQTALVVGPSGEEIYTDALGRVKVHFHWDQEGGFDENSSCWIRVSQGSAGGQYGIMFLPRVGHEVVVDFLEGDPDQPLITGRVYNGDQKPPYTLPDNKTRSVIKTHSSRGGDGTNELMFEDLKGSEKILLFAQKDLHVRVTNDRVENVDHNHHLTVKENRHELVKQNLHAEVKLDRNEKVGGKYSLKVVGDQGVEVGGAFSHKTTGNAYLKGEQNVVIEAVSGITLKVGGNFIKVDGAGVTISGALTKINSGGSAASGSAVSLNAPEAPIEADTATPGSDKTYTASPQTLGVVEAPQGFTPVEVPPDEERVSSWVEIEMVDEEGRPWPNEYYEVTLPDGKVRKGYLDRNGRAHIYLPDPVNTQVSFPNLDSDAWERL